MDFHYHWLRLSYDPTGLAHANDVPVFSRVITSSQLRQGQRMKTTNTDTAKCQLEANVFEFVMTSCFVRQATLYFPFCALNAVTYFSGGMQPFESSTPPFHPGSGNVLEGNDAGLNLEAGTFLNGIVLKISCSFRLVPGTPWLKKGQLQIRVAVWRYSMSRM